MNITVLNKILREQAISHSLCDKWQSEWTNDCDQQELIDKYKKGLDFCIENQYPANEFIKENFDRSLLHENLIFVDEHINIGYAPNGVYVLNGACTGMLHFREWAAATVYVRHTSDVSIIAEDFAKVFVRLYDEADVNVYDVGDAVVKVYDKRK